MQTFICCNCHKELPITEFSKNKSKKYGINTSCKKCTSIYKAKYRETHKEQVREYARKTAWNVRHPYCKDLEKVENYEQAKADNFIGWDRHHRLETHNSDGERRLVDLTVDELKALDMYYNRPPEELIWLRSSEHTKLHWKGKK